MKVTQKIFLILLSLFVSLFLVDWGLGMFGFPSEANFVHPPNFQEIRRNIEFQHEFKTNSRGLRYKEIPLKKPSSTFRVFVVGDSFTEGWGVAADETFSALLEKEFSTPSQTVNFINGGLSAQGPLQYGRAFFSVGQNYCPDGLLICLHANDIINMVRDLYPADLYSLRRSRINSFLHSVWPRVFMVLSNLYHSRDYREKTKPSDFVAAASKKALGCGIPQEQIDRWKMKLPMDLVAAANRGEFNAGLLADALWRPGYWMEALDIDTEEAEKKWQSMCVILSEIVERSRSQGLQVAMVFIPSPLQYDPSFHDKSKPWLQVGLRIRKEWLFGQTEVERRLEEWTQRQQIPFLNLTPVFREAVKEEWPLNYSLDRHWNAAGHRFAASAISKWLRENDVFSFITQK